MFGNAERAEVVERKIFEYRDKGEYLVHRHVVMPDHIHVILTPGPSTTLERAGQLIKGGSSYEIGAKFPVWQPGFSRHLIRDQAEFDSHVRYIDMNPVKRKLALGPEEYPFCSARAKYRLDPWPVASGAKAP